MSTYWKAGAIHMDWALDLRPGQLPRQVVTMQRDNRRNHRARRASVKVICRPTQRIARMVIRGDNGQRITVPLARLEAPAKRRGT